MKKLLLLTLIALSFRGLKASIMYTFNTVTLTKNTKLRMLERSNKGYRLVAVPTQPGQILTMRSDPMNPQHQEAFIDGQWHIVRLVTHP